MKNLKFVLIIAMFGLIYSSCNKNKDEFTPEKAKQALNETSDIILTYVDDIKNSKVFGAAESAGSLQSYKKAKKHTGQLKKHFLKVSKVVKNTIHRKAKKSAWDDSTGAFNMADYAGTFEWNKDSDDWIYTKGQPADMIVFKFPYDKNATSNNAVFTLRKYTEAPFTNEWGTYYQPSELSADLYIDENKEAAVDLGITYDSKGDMPTKIDANLFMNPFTEVYAYNINGTTLSYSTNLSKEGTTILSSEATIEFATTDYEDVNTVKGFVQIANLKLTADANLIPIMQLDENENANEADFINTINENVKAAIYTYPEENKIGDLSMTQTDEDDIDILITYSDGSQESAQPYFEKIQTSIEDVVDEMDNWYFPDIETK